MKPSDQDTIRTAVRERYTEIARSPSACGCSSTGCCSTPNPGEASRQIGYSADELAALPEGVDMTPDMVSKARAAAGQGDFGNVEFRLGEIEHIPAADSSVDVIMSNCVINLSPDKAQVFREAFRVLRSGGRIAVSDVVATQALPDDVKRNLDQHAGCISGAAPVSDVEDMLHKAGFCEITAAESRVMQVIRDNLKGCCAGCAVPVGVFKTMQVAAGLALPKDVTIQISKMNEGA